MVTFTQWEESVRGKPIDNSSGYPDPECTDLWRDYLMDVIGAPWNTGVSGSTAANLWHNQASNSDSVYWLQKVAHPAAGQLGDGAIWGATTKFPTGHVAIVVADLGDALEVWSQNHQRNQVDVHYAEKVKLNKSNLLGYLRPKYNNPFNPNIPQEDNMLYQIIESEGKNYFCTGAGVALIESEQHRLNLVAALTTLRARDEIEPDGGMGPTARGSLTYYVAKARA